MKISVENTADRQGFVRFTIETNSERFHLDYESENAALSPRLEAAVTATLLMAMSRGEDIEVDGELDAHFLRRLDHIQDIYTCWSPAHSRIRVVAGSGPVGDENDGSSLPQIASFYSGGVDSSYTLIKHRDGIDRLVFVLGFDIDADDENACRQATRRLGKIAEAFDKELVVIRTNLRNVIRIGRPSSRLGAWEFSHGSALASVAHVLPDDMNLIYVPATSSYLRLRPWGSHPVLDPLWSSSRMEIVHDGGESNRFEKCEVVARNPDILAHLHVCWQGDSTSYNCGKCEKCVRTMVAFTALGALDGKGPFATELTPRLIRSVDLRRRGFEKYFLQAFPKLKRRDPRLALSALYTVATSRVRRHARSARNMLNHYRKGEQ